MDGRRPRVNVMLTGPESQWLDWWAAHTGRLRAEAAGRLLSQAIQQERASPALERVYQEDLRRGPIETQVLGDVALAFETPGVAAVLQGHLDGQGPEARRAARYLQDVSAWITDPRLPTEKGPPPRLHDTEDRPLVDRGVASAMDLIDRSGRQVLRHHGPQGTLRGSDKRTLSDIAPAPAGEEV